MKTKIILFMLVIILFTIFVSQNTKIAELNFLTWKFELSTIVIIAITFFVGMIAGFMVVGIFADKGKNKKEIKNDNSVSNIVNKEK